MKSVKLTVTAVLLCGAIYGQDSFHAGYYIDANGQRIEGLIRNMDWQRAPEYFAFKKSDADVVKEVAPGEAKRFSVDDVTFDSYSVQLDQSGNRPHTYSHKRDPEWRQQTVFLKLDTDGYAKLYEYYDGQAKRFFYAIDTNPIPLVYKKYFTDVTELAVATNESYKQQLWNEVKCPQTTQSDLDRLGYETRELKKYFDQVNHCKGNFVSAANAASVDTPIAWNVKICAVAGLHSFSYNLATAYDFPNKAYVSPALELECLLPFRNHKYGVILEPTYTTYKDNAGDAQKNQINMRYLRLPVGLRYYMYQSRRSRFLIDGGMNFDLISSQSTIKAIYALTDKVYDFRSFPITFYVGAGYAFARWSAEIRYNSPANADPYTSGKYTYRDLSAMIRFEILGNHSK